MNDSYPIPTINVYKTDVDDPIVAEEIVETIHNTFPGSEANFDLEDCDRVLRVVSQGNAFDEGKLRNILLEFDHKMVELNW